MDYNAFLHKILAVQSIFQKSRQIENLDGVQSQMIRIFKVPLYSTNYSQMPYNRRRKLISRVLKQQISYKVV